jgi:hypothetical protein
LRQALRRLVRLAAREPRDGEDRELLRGARQDRRLLARDEGAGIGLRAIERLVVERMARGQQGVGALRLLHEARGEQLAHAIPGIGLGHFLRGGELREHGVARGGRLASRGKQRAGFARHFRIGAGDPLLERITGDLDVLRRHFRLLGAETLPGPGGAEGLEPFAAQGFSQRR